MEVLQVAAGEMEAAEGPRVRGEDAGNGGGDAPRISASACVAADEEEVGVDEDERGGAPDPAPAAGERR